jgi:hypothetical protein
MNNHKFESLAIGVVLVVLVSIVVAVVMQISSRARSSSDPCFAQKKKEEEQEIRPLVQRSVDEDESGNSVIVDGTTDLV